MCQCWIQSQLERGDQAPRYLEIQNVQGGFRASGTLTAEIPTYSRRMRLVKLGNLHNARLASEFRLNLMRRRESRSIYLFSLAPEIIRMLVAIVRDTLEYQHVIKIYKTILI